MAKSVFEVPTTIPEVEAFAKLFQPFPLDHRVGILIVIRSENC